MPKQHSPDLWDSVAKGYDGMRPDQGLTDPRVRAAWQTLLAAHLPEAPVDVLDVGCGTGTLSLLLAEMGHTVTGVDFAPGMIAEAQKKAELRGLPVRFAVGDGSNPPLDPRSVDAIVCRQVLWALPHPKQVLATWTNLLTPGGTLLLIEGRFASGNGMASEDVAAALPDAIEDVITTDLSADASLWGGPLSDERYLVVGKRRG